MELHASPSTNTALSIFTLYFSIRGVAIKCAISIDKWKNVNRKEKRKGRKALQTVTVKLMAEVRVGLTKKGENEMAVLLTLSPARGAACHGNT